MNGAIATDLSGGMVRDNPELNKRIADMTALGRAGLPDDIGSDDHVAAFRGQSLDQRSAHRALGRNVDLGARRALQAAPSSPHKTPQTIAGRLDSARRGSELVEQHRASLSLDTDPIQHWRKQNTRDLEYALPLFSVSLGPAVAPAASWSPIERACIVYASKDDESRAIGSRRRGCEGSRCNYRKRFGF